MIAVYSKTGLNDYNCRGGGVSRRAVFLGVIHLDYRRVGRKWQV